MTDSEILQRYVDEVQPVTNWPEWNGNAEGPHRPKRTRPMRLVLFTDDLWWDVESNDGQGWAFLRAVCDHEALCLWRDWVRVWLEERHIIVRLEYHDDRPLWYLGKHAGGRYQLYGGIPGLPATQHWAYESYDDALIAAVKATKEQ